jgi:hypothetical protein
VVDLLRWPQVAPEILNGLITQAKSLDIVYAAMLDNDAVDPEIAASLRAFPQDFLATGDLGALPRFKSVPRLPDEGLLANSAAGFTIIDFGADATMTERGAEVPLVACGPSSELALSLPVLVAGQALNLSWNTVAINIGTTLQFGESTEPIPLDAAGKVVVPLGEPESLQRIGGDRLIGTDAPVDVIRDAVLIVGSDLDRDRVFPLPDGQRISRAELVSRTVCYLLETATAAPAPPLSKPVTVSKESSTALTEKAHVEKPGPSSSDRKVYRFPDLRGPNIGLWILGISCGLGFGCLLLLSNSKAAQSRREEDLKEVPEPGEKPSDARETVGLTKRPEPHSGKRLKEKKSAAMDATNEDLPEVREPIDDAAASTESSRELTEPPKTSRKPLARKKNSRSRRRRPS